MKDGAKMQSRHVVERWKAEPGKRIIQQVSRFLENCSSFGHRHVSQEVLTILEGLPYRDEVSNGRDLRGIDLAIVCQMDFNEFDFSFARLTNFVKCSFVNTKFTHADLHGVHPTCIDGASFCSAKLRQCSIESISARACNFESADLFRGSFVGADLGDSSFHSAKCKGACFVRANLRGCDFRKADLTDAIIGETLLDKSTDFRGACLINIQGQDRIDRAGNVLFKGTDWRQGTWDAATLYGEDPSLSAVELLAAVTDFLDQTQSETDRKIMAVVRDSMDQLKVKFDKRWYDKILAKLSDLEKQRFEQVGDLASRSLL
jgi:uncharacterized protein YjbI with pentapeptide repeats